MSGSSFMDALLDPGMQALAGMAQGFAQGAMPSRMPIPTGAALGMGMGGLAQGLGNGLQLQRASMQNKVAASAMPAELAKNQMLANMWQHPEQFQQMMGGGAATPFGAPAAAVSAPPAAAPVAPVTGGGTPTASNPAIQPLVSAAAAKYGIPEPLANAYLQQESSLGTNPAANGNIGQITFKTAANPGYGMQPLAGADLTDPAKNIDFSMQYLRKAGDAAGVKDWSDPSQWGTALKAYNGGGDPNYVQNVARFLPKSTMMPGGVTQGSFQVAQAGGGPVPVPSGGVPAQGSQQPDQGAQFTGPNTGANAMLMYQKYEGMARQADQQQQNMKWLTANGIPPIGYVPIGDPAMLRSSAQKFLDIATAYPKASEEERAKLQYAAQIAAAQANAQVGPHLTEKGFAQGPNGTQQFIPGGAADPAYIAASAGSKAAATSQAQLPAELTKLGFRATPGGGMEPIPGGIADPQQVGATEAAKAFAQAAAQRTHLITTRAGVFDPVSRQEIYRQPEYHELQDPNSGVEYPSFIQPGENGQLNITGGPPGMASGALPPSKLGPGQEDTIKHLADQYAKEDKQKYEGATNSLFQLSQQDANIAALNQGGGWSSTGTGANAKMEWAKGVNSALQTLGVTPIMDPAKVASWEDATKIQTQLAFAQAKQLGSREAQQVISMSRAATPGAENTPQGYQAISSGYHEMNNREVDAYNFKTAWLQAHGGNLMGAETAFNNQFTPAMYAARAVSTVKPVKITTNDQAGAAAEMAHYLPGTVVQFPSGKQTIVPPNQASPPVPSYIQGYLKPQGAPNAP